MKFVFKMTPIELLDGKENIIVRKGLLLEGKNFYTIGNMESKSFNFTSTTRLELDTALSCDFLRMRKSAEDDRHCSECEEFMQEGFLFESDGTMYCSEKCLIKVSSWMEYLSKNDDGNGDAYWTVLDCMGRFLNETVKRIYSIKHNLKTGVDSKCGYFQSQQVVPLS